MPQITTIPSDTAQAQVLLRTAAYCRTSSDSTDQQHSYTAQVKHYSLADVRALDEALANITETLTIFDEVLFAEIVRGISVSTPVELRFTLLGGLTLSEALPRPERRSRR